MCQKYLTKLQKYVIVYFVIMITLICWDANKSVRYIFYDILCIVG